MTPARSAVAISYLETHEAKDHVVKVLSALKHFLPPVVPGQPWWKANWKPLHAELERLGVLLAVDADGHDPTLTLSVAHTDPAHLDCCSLTLSVTAPSGDETWPLLARLVARQRL